VAHRARGDEVACVVIDDLSRNDRIRLRLDDEDITLETSGAGEHSVLVRVEPTAPVRREVGVQIELSLRSIKIHILVQRRGAKGQPLHLSLTGKQGGQVAAVAAAHDPDPLGEDTRRLEQKVVGGDEVAKVLRARHRLDLPPGMSMAAKIERQARAIQEGEPLRLGDVSSLGTAPAVNEKHGSLRIYGRLRQDELAADVLPVDRNADVLHIGSRDMRVITV